MRTSLVGGKHSTVLSKSKIKSQISLFIELKLLASICKWYALANNLRDIKIHVIIEITNRNMETGYLTITLIEKYNNKVALLNIVIQYSE